MGLIRCLGDVDGVISGVVYTFKHLRPDLNNPKNIGNKGSDDKGDVGSKKGFGLTIKNYY